jgi:hypothetical protein
LQSFGRKPLCADAYAMLTPELQHSLPPEKLESHYDEMIAYGGDPVTVDGHTES